MSENTPQGDPQDQTETSPLELADQGPTDVGGAAAEAAPAQGAAATPAAKGGSNTRTILEIVGGVVAGGLIVVAGIGGCALGAFAASDERHGFDGDRAVAEHNYGEQGFGGEQGQMMPGQQGMRDHHDFGDHHGMEGFGEGQGQMMPGQGMNDGMMPGAQQGQLS